MTKRMRRSLLSKFDNANDNPRVKILRRSLFREFNVAYTEEIIERKMKLMSITKKILS